jgi:hypothetical protein
VRSSPRLGGILPLHLFDLMKDEHNFLGEHLVLLAAGRSMEDRAAVCSWVNEAEARLDVRVAVLFSADPIVPRYARSGRRADSLSR